MVTHAAIKIWFSQDGCTSSNVCNSAAQNFFSFPFRVKIPQIKLYLLLGLAKFVHHNINFLILRAFLT